MLDRKYKVALKEFIALGKDGFDCLVDENSDIEWLITAEGSVLLQKIVYDFFERMQADYHVDPRREIGRQRLMKNFNTHDENLDPSGKFIMIAPEAEGRIINLADKELAKKQTLAFNKLNPKHDEDNS